MIRDLLNPSSGILDLFEDSSGEIVVSGLLEVETSCTLEVMRLLRRGNLRRTVEPTAANKTSSRSHAILKVPHCITRNFFLEEIFTFISPPAVIMCEIFILRIFLSNVDDYIELMLIFSCMGENFILRSSSVI